jgi:hypothetical protein
VANATTELGQLVNGCVELTAIAAMLSKAVALNCCRWSAWTDIDSPRGGVIRAVPRDLIAQCASARVAIAA